MNTITASPASLLRRLAAIIYDVILLFSVLFVASIPVVAMFNITWGNPNYGYYRAGLFLLCFLYFGWFWVHGGQTLGMKSWGIRLRSNRGPTISWLQVVLRFVAAIASWGAFGMGFLWSLLREDRATWHDLISDSRLIREIRED